MIGRRILSRPGLVQHDASITMPERAKYLSTVLAHFRERFMKEYLTEVREHHRSTAGGQSKEISTGDVVTVLKEKAPRQTWRIGHVQKLLKGADGKVRSAQVKVAGEGGRMLVLRRPIQKLFPLESHLREQAVPIQFVDDTDVITFGQ